MIKKTIAFVLFSVVCLTVEAQHKPIQFGFSAGINGGWYGSNQENYLNDGVKLGASWGFVGDIFLMEGYSINTGFNVVFLNGKMTLPWAETEDQITTKGTLSRIFKNKYVEVPFIFTMKTKEIKEKYRIYGQIGFGMSFLLNARADDHFTGDDGITVIDNKNRQIKDMMRFTRESLILGTGAEFPLTGSTYLRAGLKYDNAFINVFSGNNPADPSLAHQGTNHFIEFNISVIF